MPRNHWPQRFVERTPWRPGFWIMESGGLLNVRDSEPFDIRYTLMTTVVTISKAMAAADKTIRNMKDPE